LSSSGNAEAERSIAERTVGLVVSAGVYACALPIGHVVETMRPLPTEPVAGAKAFVRGLALIRGAAVPVIDLANVIGVSEARAPTRFVTVRVGDRTIALAVNAVVGIRELDSARLQQMPPLLRGASSDAVDAIGTLDAQLLVVLRAGRILDEETWRMVEGREGSA